MIKFTGIIAEYNPFHNGHKHQIEHLRSLGTGVIAVAMSGDFVQRGAPAWTDKYTRTQMALSQGADLVFELPTVYTLCRALCVWRNFFIKCTSYGQRLFWM